MFASRFQCTCTRHFAAVVVLGLSILGLLFVEASPAFAGLSARHLLGSAVENYGPEFLQVELAVKEFQDGDHEGAYRRLKTFCESRADLPPAEILMALLYLSEYKLPPAYAALEAAAAAHPEDPEAYLIVADLALRERRMLVADLGYGRARGLVDAYEANPRRKHFLAHRVYAGLSSLTEARGQYAAAREHLREWIKLEPDNALAYGSLGRVSFHLQDVAAAREAFTRLTEIDGNAPPVEIAMARLYTDANDIDHARKEIEAALEHHGQDIRTRLTVAEWALDNGFVDLASENVAVALKFDNTSVGAQVLRARLARLYEDDATAESLLVAAVLKSPNEFSLTNEYARLLATSEDAEQRKSGLEYAERNYNSYRDRSTGVGREALMTYAWLLFRNGRQQQAEDVLHKLPNRSPVSKENAYYAGAIYAGQGRNELAKQALSAALATSMAFIGRTDAEALLHELEGHSND